MIQKPRGTQDLFGSEAANYQSLRTMMRDIFQTYNLKPIQTPIFEAKDLFVRSVGSTSDVVKKEMYEFADKKGRQLVLRPEGTAPIVRAVIENKLYDLTNLPLKFYYSGPMFRYERPQIGRNRQFEQVGVEFFGAGDVYQDLEVLGVTVALLKALNLNEKVQFDLNFLVTGASRQTYIADLKAYFKTFKNLCADCQSRLKTNPLRVLDCKIDGAKFTSAPAMDQYLSAADQTRLTQIITGLKKLGINPVLNPKLVRGLDYYTGLIFEIKYESQKLGSQSTIIAGGRYDQLVSELGGPDLPAIGFACGMERLVIACEENKFAWTGNDALDLYTIALTPQAKELNQSLIFTFRQAGMKVDTNYLNRSLKSAFKQAEKFQAKKIIVLGDQEVATQTVTIKDQIKKTNVTVPIKELVKFLREKA